MQMAHKQTILKDIAYLSLFIILFYGFWAGERPLSHPDEGRYTEISREMVATGDYVTPRLNGVKYFEKPPLTAWLVAGSIKVFGVNEWGLRFWPMMFGLLGCIAVYFVGYQLYGRGVAIASSLVLSTALLYYALSHVLILDMTVSTFITLAAFSYLLAAKEPKGRSQTLYLAGFYVCAALATLSKGLIGAVLSGGIILIWAIISRSWKQLWLAFKPWGVLLFFAVAAPWHILVSLRNPEFFDFYFIYEHFTRFLSKDHGRYQPVYFFIPIIIAGLFPWFTLLPQSLLKAWKDYKKTQDLDLLYLAVWIFFIFVFFSLSNSKLIPYILPVFPPLALLLGRYVIQLWNGTDQCGAKWGLQAFNLLIAAMVIALPIVLYTQDLLYSKDVRAMLIISEILLVVLTAVIFVLNKNNQVKQALCVMGLASVILLPTVYTAWPHLEIRSIKSLAMELKERASDDDLVISYKRYYQDLAPYIERIVTVVDAFGELTFGTEVEDTSAWMIKSAQFEDLMEKEKDNKEKKIFIVTRKEFYHDILAKKYKNLYSIAETKRDILLVTKND